MSRAWRRPARAWWSPASRCPWSGPWTAAASSPRRPPVAPPVINYINCRILETTLLQECSNNPNPNMPLQTYAILCNLYPRRYIAPVCLKQLTWWWLSEMHQLSEMNAYLFLRNFLKTHIGNENPESPEDEFNRVNRWSVSRFQHSYWLVLFTLQSRTEKSGKLLNFSPIFRIFAFF